MHLFRLHTNFHANISKDKKVFLKNLNPSPFNRGDHVAEIRKIAISFNWGIVAASKPVHVIEEIKVGFNFLAEGRSPFRAHFGG